MINNKVVLITGASAGLGKALAENCAARGAHLVLCARREHLVDKLRDDLIRKRSSLEIMTMAVDVRDKLANQEMVAKTIKHFGRLDVVVANAGLGMWARFRDVDDPDQLQDLMNVNYMGVVYALFYALPHLRHYRGSFVAVSSIQGTIPVAFHTGYVASKYAVNGLIETLRLEEPDIHFLLALPSWIAGTELRTQAIKAESSALSVNLHHDKNVRSASVVAEEIIAALIAKKKEIFIPKAYRLLPITRALFTTRFDKIVMNKVKRQLTRDVEPN